MTATLDGAPPTAPLARATCGAWLGFAGVMGATVMDLLDSTVVGVAAPAIRADLGGSYATMQWMAAGYTLALAVLLLVGGRLGDMFGRRRMLLVGVAGFTAVSLLCALAWNPEVLAGARIAQGAFGAVMLPQGFGLLRDIFPPHQMAKAWGLFGPVMGIGAVVGPIVGGLLLEADVLGTGWRMVFLVNIPIGIVSYALAARHLPTVAPVAAGSRLDLPGVALAAAGTVLLIFPLVQGHELGWPGWTIAMMIAAVPVFAAFARRQLRLTRRGRTPLIEPSIFGKRSYVAGVGFAVVFLAAMGAMFTVGVMLQIGLGFSPMQASLTMAPWAGGAVIGSIIAGTMTARLGRLLLHIGLVLMGAGVIGLVAAYQLAGVELGFLALALPLLVGGTGMGMIFVPMFDIILSGVGDHETGSASGALGALEQFGMTLGVAILGTVFFTIVGPVPTPQAALAAGSVTALVTLGLVALAFVIAFAMPRRATAHAHG
ncbi:MFS transporter [Pseudonocardia sp. GCM10023141]|uniref:MFS transporter n=1 Tax=Pseudonocardia sp. GCM10023141 TaxID=3252653 RepID=UPI00360DF3B3